jgi:hypothetical protein
LKDFLATQLQGARRYQRIAGFFSSSLLEVAGEALERMTPEDGGNCVRMVCNSCLNPLDVQTARAAKWEIPRECCKHFEVLARYLRFQEARFVWVYSSYVKFVWS